MKPTLTLTARSGRSEKRRAAVDAGRKAMEISLGGNEGLRIIRRLQPAIVWRKPAKPDVVSE
jgi:hypothetical protein